MLLGNFGPGCCCLVGGKLRKAESFDQLVNPRRLIPAAGGGRVAAFEVMLNNPAIENHIRKNETFKIPSVIQTSRRQGMIETMAKSAVRSGGSRIGSALMRGVLGSLMRR